LLTYLIVLAQVQATSTSAWKLAWHAGPMVKFVLLILIVLSILTWAIIGLKFYQLRKAQKESQHFLKSFWAGESLERVTISTRRFSSTPLAQVFRAGMTELELIRKGRKSDDEKSLEDITREDMGMENVERTLHRAAAIEMNRLSRFLSFLATTGSTAPFIGLFGTVWGIMTSFQHISPAGGAAGFDMISRGISEALIATAAGLAAAIPAVVAYNYFLSGLKTIQSELDNFQSEFINILDRHYMKKRMSRKNSEKTGA